jgi:uncharacterized protein (TIGR03437 family)
MKRSVWLIGFLLVETLSADPPPYVIATAAGYIPGVRPLALAQHLVQPVMVAYDPDGTLYYATVHQVWRLNADATATLVAGNGANTTVPSGDGGLAAAASISWVNGLAIDLQHNVYISDLWAYKVRKVTPDGLINGFAGTGGHPYYSDSSSAGGPAPANRVSMVPGPLLVDSGNLYVSDSATASVLLFPLDGLSSRVVVGNHGNVSAGDGGPASNASLFNPGTLALANNVLYVNEANGARIRQVVFRTGVITTLVQLSKSAFLSDNGNPGLAADSDGSVYIQQGNSIVRVPPGANAPQPWAGGGNASPGDPGPAGQAALLNPASLAINPLTHDLSLADANGNIVQTIDGSAHTIQTVAGIVHFAGDGGPAALAIFNGLESVVSDGQGNLYVADVGNNRIRKIDSNGIVTTVAGTGVVGFSGDGGPAVAATLSLKHTPAFNNNLAIDPNGNLFVSDYGNGRIRKIDTTGVITTVAGGGSGPVVRGGVALSAAIQPGPLAVDASSNIYFGNVLSTGAAAIPTIYKIDGNGLFSVFAGGPVTVNGTDSGPAITTPIGSAYCLVADARGNFYICDSAYNRVREVAPNGIMTTIAGNGSSPGGAIQSGPPAATAIGPPTAVAVDPKGNVYIYSLRQISEIDATGKLQLFAGINSGPLTSGGDGGWVSQATFASVGGMTFDASANLYLTDAGIYLRQAIPVGSNGVPPIILGGGIVGAGASNPPVQVISPGAMVSIFGSNFLALGTQRSLQSTDLTSGKLPTNLGGICVSFGGVNAAITGVFPNQINVQAPDLPPGPVTVQVTANCGGTSPVPGNLSAVRVDVASPEFFTATDLTSGKNYVAAVNIATGFFTAGATVEAFGTGWGTTSPGVAAGSIPAVAAQLAEPPQITLGGLVVPAADVLYVGVSPCCAGLYQLDFTIPSGTPKGDQPLIITVDGVSSPANAFLTVQ